jgi:hypothetical protein
MEQCNCLIHCGDDPWLKTRRVRLCRPLIEEAHARALRDNMLRDFRPVLAAKLTRKQQATICALFPELAA